MPSKCIFNPDHLLHVCYLMGSCVVQTEECLDSFDFEMAALFCQRALDVDSNNLQALDMLGHICTELGDTQKAKGISFMQVSSLFACQLFCHFMETVIFTCCLSAVVVVASLTNSLQVFLRAVELSPDEGHNKYMYLGQIHSGQEAVDYYTKGIQVLLSALDKQAQTKVSEPR